MSDNSTQNGSDIIRDIDRGGGVKTQITQLDAGGSASEKLVNPALPLPTKVCDTGKTMLQFYATGVASGATGVETAVPLAKAGTLGAAPAGAANSLVPASGKRFRITSITFCSRGHATATAQVTTFNLRVNSAGAVATTSTGILLQARVATPATASAWDRVTFNFEGEGPELIGDGTLQWGLTANAVFTTNAPTWDALITGYEYTV